MLLGRSARAVVKRAITLRASMPTTIRPPEDALTFPKKMASYHSSGLLCNFRVSDSPRVAHQISKEYGCHSYFELTTSDKQLLNNSEFSELNAEGTVEWVREVFGLRPGEHSVDLDALKKSHVRAVKFLHYSSKGIEKKFGISECEAKMIFNAVQLINNSPIRGHTALCSC